MKLELFWPTEFKIITQGWGLNGDWYRAHGINIKGHNGLDLFAQHGDPIRAAHDGTVTFCGQDGAAGWGVVLRTDDEREYGTSTAFFKTIYWHFIPNIPVKAGQKVRCGDILGYADNTGLSTGDHLHWGLKPIGKGEEDWTWFNLEQDNGYLGAIDPTPYLSNLTAKQYADTLTLIGKLKEKVAELISRYKK